MSDELPQGTEYEPEKDPLACSICGTSLGLTSRVSGEDYCDQCQKEYGGLL